MLKRGFSLSESLILLNRDTRRFNRIEKLDSVRIIKSWFLTDVFVESAPEVCLPQS